MATEQVDLLAALRWFACPACHGLLGSNGGKIVCAGCGRRYPVEDGIPVLLKARASTESGTD